MLIADTSALLALFTRNDRQHVPVADFLRHAQQQLVLSPFVVAELDYMVSQRVGTAASSRMLTTFTSAAYELPAFVSADLRSAIAVIDRYPDQAIGVTDASLVVLADRYRTFDILTLDYRHFDVLRPLQGGRFRLMPRDWDGL